MGVAIAPERGALRVSGKAAHPVAVDAAGFPDAVPVLCAIASRLSGESVFSGVEHLRLKESDRIEAIREMLAAAGAASAVGEGEIRAGGGAADPPSVPMFPTIAS
jgi:3-phosphoshikimate 1-carboxyvinyltransferase